MNGPKSRLRFLAAMAWCVVAALCSCTVNPVPTPAKTTGGGVQGNEDNNGLPTGLADAAEPGKTNDSADGGAMGAASETAPPAAEVTAVQDGGSEIATGEVSGRGQD